MTQVPDIHVVSSVGEFDPFGRDAPLRYVALSSSNRKDTQIIDHQPADQWRTPTIIPISVKNPCGVPALRLQNRPPLQLRCFHVCFLFSCVSKNLILYVARYFTTPPSESSGLES